MPTRTNTLHSPSLSLSLSADEHHAWKIAGWRINTQKATLYPLSVLAMREDADFPAGVTFFSSSSNTKLHQFPQQPDTSRPCRPALLLNPIQKQPLIGGHE